MTQPYRGRYAPSPTGPLHLGNLRTALAAWLHTRLMHGTFVLRIEDLDMLRAVDGGAEQMMEDLRWLGLDWDEGPDVGGPFGPYVQSDRQEIYEFHLQQLIKRGVVYPCFCSRKDIRMASSAPHGIDGIVYPGTCQHLTAADVEAQRAARDNREPTWRLRVDDQPMVFSDGFYGPQSQQLARDVGDFILKRRDGFYAYQLAVVVDDALMQVTDVLRGEDLLASTARQIFLYRCFDWHVPRFWHVPLMLDAQGQKLSKRDGAASLDEYRAKGMAAADIIGMLAKSLGLRHDDSPIELKNLLAQLTLEQFLNANQREVS